MQKNIVIVESPAKAQTIGRFLGKEYKVLPSYGHIRDLRRTDLSIDMPTLTPCYEIPAEKAKVVETLRRAVSKADVVWLASDEDREGEAIAWHLSCVLSLDAARTRRIVFHEITKSAILAAIDHPRAIDMHRVDAQTARRVLDRVVGFNLSPILWKKVKPSLSAGRVQSVAVRLLVERERELQQFTAEAYYRVTGTFLAGADSQEIAGELSVRYPSSSDAAAFLSLCQGATYTVASVVTKPARRSPAPPFTTSTLQQEASRRLGFPVALTMRVAQRLYENGLITYMRTDSVNLSSLCLSTARDEITALYGDAYCHTRNYQTHSHGAQEAHEAIRPTVMAQRSISGTAQEQRLYDLIWKRTIASQMSDEQIEKTTITIAMDNAAATFVATGEVVLFDGYQKVYHDSGDDDSPSDAAPSSLPKVSEGQVLQRGTITATERYPSAPARYSEGTLVKKLEELGIGRPSTYAPTISTIQQRDYVVKGDSKGTERPYTVLTLTDKGISTTTKKETVGKEKGKLLPTDVGIVVTDFLLANFPQILDYNFTANVEEKFDSIAAGALTWQAMIHDFWDVFKPDIDKALATHQDHKAGERLLGSDPTTGRAICVKIGRYGPVVQMGAASDKEKPRFAQVPKDKSIETLTLDEALTLFLLPRVVGEKDGKEVTIGSGRYGPYILYDGRYTSLPAGVDPLTVTLSEASALLAAHHEQAQKKIIKTFADEHSSLQIVSGRYGPYIVYEGNNYRIPKEWHTTASELTLAQCLAFVAAAPDKSSKGKRKRRS